MFKSNPKFPKPDSFKVRPVSAERFQNTASLSSGLSPVEPIQNTDSLASRFSPADLLQELIAPRKFTDTAPNKAATIELPSLGTLNYSVWRGVIFAIPPSTQDYTSIGARVALDADLSTLSRYFGTGATLSQLRVERKTSSSKTSVDSRQVLPGFQSKIQLVSTRAQGSVPRLEAIVMDMQFDLGGFSGSFSYSMNRAQGATGCINLQSHRGKIKIVHDDKATFRPGPVIGGLFSINETPTLLNQPLNALVGLGISADILRRLI